jgi:hypothetical protein
MRWALLALLLMFAAAAAAKEMWRWTDERGVVHFSDRPHPGAERVEIGPAQTYQAPPVPAPAPRAAETAPVAAASYSRLSVLAPEEGETLWNIGGELNVQVVVEPPLAGGHELRLYLDGEPVANVPQRQAQFTISEVWRGERRLRASIVDERGRELVSSEPVVFYVQQTTLQRPPQARPPVARPRPGG